MTHAGSARTAAAAGHRRGRPGTVVDVPDEEAARLWAGKIAVARGWPQEVRRFQVPMQLPEIT